MFLFSCVVLVIFRAEFTNKLINTLYSFYVKHLHVILSLKYSDVKNIIKVFLKLNGIMPSDLIFRYYNFAQIQPGPGPGVEKNIEPGPGPAPVKN